MQYMYRIYSIPILVYLYSYQHQMFDIQDEGIVAK